MPFDPPLAVVPILVGPLQVLLTLLPAILLAIGSALLASLRPSALWNTARVLWRQKVQVLVVMLCAAALVWGGGRFWQWLRPAAGRAEEGALDWPTARGGLARLGAAERAVGPDGGGLHWSWKQGSEAFFSSPTLVGNRVYVASATFGAFASSGKIYCFDADTGAIAWQSAPPGYRPTFSSPVVSGHYLVCGEGLHTTRDARVVCLDLRPGKEGQVLWTFATKSHVECTPVIHENRVYVGAGDDGYYCLELEPDARGQAQLVWHAPGEKYQDAETALAVFEDKVYAGLGVGGRALCVLDARTGEELRRLPMPYPVFSPPAIAGGKLYVGSGNGDFANSAAQLLAAEMARLEAEKAPQEALAAARESLASAGEVRCIDLATLQTDWVFPTADTVLGAVAVAGDQLYFGSRDGHLYALDRNGKLLGKWNSRSGIVASPAVTERYVYLVNEAGLLYGLDRRTLAPAWEFRLGAATSLLGAPPLYISSPAVGRNRVYVGTQYEGLICAGHQRQGNPPALWPGPLAGAGRGGCQDDSPLPELGEVSWSFPETPLEASADAPVQGPVAAVENKLLVPWAGARPGLVCLSGENPSLAGAAPLWRHDTLHGVFASPAIAGELAFAVDGKPGDKGRNLHCLELASGKARWQAGLAPEASGVFCAGEEAVWIQAAPGKLACLDHAGALRYTRDVGELAHPPTAAGAMLVAAVQQPPALVALDLPTGIELWRVSLEHRPLAGPAIGESTIYLPTAAGIEARSLAGGAPLPGWRLEGGAPSADCALLRAGVAYINLDGELILLGREDGAVERRFEGLLPGTTPVAGRNALLLAAEFQLLRLPLDEEDAEPLEWLETTSLGRLVSPPVLHGSAVYFGTSARGLARAAEPAPEPGLVQP